MEELLQVKDLSISFHTYNGEVQAVRNASFDLHRKEVLAIVGESGSGKSVTMQTVLKLTPCELKSGQIIFDGKDITHYTDKQMQEIRGSQIGIIFQDAMTSLNPTMKIGRQITESILRHQKVNKAEAKEKALELLVQVGINNPEKRYHQYIHNLSGGMRQRVMIAIALACKPKLLIAGRTHHGAGRDHPGPDHGPAGQAKGGGGVLYRTDYPRLGRSGGQCRPHCGHVCRPGSGIWHG